MMAVLVTDDGEVERRVTRVVERHRYSGYKIGEAIIFRDEYSLAAGRWRELQTPEQNQNVSITNDPRMSMVADDTGVGDGRYILFERWSKGRMTVDREEMA